MPAADRFTGLRFDVRPVRYAGTKLLRVAIGGRDVRCSHGHTTSARHDDVEILHLIKQAESTAGADLAYGPEGDTDLTLP